MDFSKKYDISVYLTEEQLNKRIAEIGAQNQAHLRTVFLSHLTPAEGRLNPHRPTAQQAPCCDFLSSCFPEYILLSV